MESLVGEARSARGVIGVGADPEAAAMVATGRFNWESAPDDWQLAFRKLAAVLAADWQQLSDMRRQAFHAMFARVPAQALRAGLTNAAAADTAWVIASPDAHDQLVRQAGYTYDQLEDWVRTTLSAALFSDK